MPDEKPRPAYLFTIPRDTAPAPCTGCRQLIYWIVTAAGKRMPVSTRCEGGLEPLADRDGHGISHFADCPEAEAFRRARPRRAESRR